MLPGLDFIHHLKMTKVTDSFHTVESRMEPHAMLAKIIWRRLQLSIEVISLVIKDIGLYLIRPPSKITP